MAITEIALYVILAIVSVVAIFCGGVVTTFLKNKKDNKEKAIRDEKIDAILTEIERYKAISNVTVDPTAKQLIDMNIEDKNAKIARLKAGK